eukprot:TRINITY_DN14388_c0_g2_i1.p1 TRINITY_DN14388_c0_g2~~TRINITY_DN14388_c0_g2_i1.p1  ORF type:complete len:511 (+),score=136.56 TRINITY_DN14388_c0_g2_i1:65-1597(+)
MSDVYIKEPPTKGKALFQTTHGDLEIELWATEAPKACRNFCQLILEGYYNGTGFHRVIKEFCIQGGDATGTGDGCESIYGKPYPDEIHPRLKFRYRGLMAVASAGKGTNTNGSQFFIALNRLPSLDGKHTIFAKVVGQTVYNLVRISEVECDKHDCPVDPPRIIRSELLWDPFGDLEPRYKPQAAITTSTGSQEQHRRAPVKNKKVLSFADDGDDSSDDDDNKASASASSKGKSAHDLLHDKKLSSEAAYPEEARAKRVEGKRTAPVESSASDAKRSTGADRRPAAAGARGKAPVRKAKASDEEEVDYGGSDDSDSDSDADTAKQPELSREEMILKLKQDIAGLKSGVKAPEAPRKQLGALAEAARKGYTARGSRGRATTKEGRRKEAEEVVMKLKSFQERLQDIKDDSEEEDPEEKERIQKRAEAGSLSAIWEEGDEEVDKGWLNGGGLKFHTTGDKAYEIASRKANSTLEIFDPIASSGNAEALADARKRRAQQLVPSLRRKDPLKTW